MTEFFDIIIGKYWNDLLYKYLTYLFISDDSIAIYPRNFLFLFIVFDYS
jgi:hypothetical protein